MTEPRTAKMAGATDRMPVAHAEHERDEGGNGHRERERGRTVPVAGQASHDTRTGAALPLVTNPAILQARFYPTVPKTGDANRLLRLDMDGRGTDDAVMRHQALPNANKR